MEDYSHVQQPDLRYQYQFGMDQLDQMSDCLETHGFAIVKDVLPEQMIDSLKQAVFDGTDPDRTLNQGESGTRHAWVESGAGAWQLLEYHPFMTIHQHLIGTDQVTIHRSAAIIRMPESSPVAWHTDWCGFSTQIKNSADFRRKHLRIRAMFSTVDCGLPASGSISPDLTLYTEVYASSKIHTLKTGQGRKGFG